MKIYLLMFLFFLKKYGFSLPVSTNSPSNIPSTSFPTRSDSPTKSPRAVFPGKIMYKIPQGAAVSLKRTTLPLNGTTNYSILSGASTPMNSTMIISSDTTLIPVRWANVIYRLFNATTFSTSTKTITNCNPANPADPPGSVTWDSLDGEGQYTCPSINLCILTNNCTDDLNPLLNATSGKYYDWPDLRSCICSYDVETRFDVSTITDVTRNVSITELYASYTDPDAIERLYSQTNAIGVVYCNSFIDRQINCQIQQLLPSYIQQCRLEPIGCYNDTLGYAFGGFWNQNLNFTYDIPRSEWTLKHYQGIGSTMNNKVYRNSLNKLTDPFTSKIFADYLWITNITALFPQTVVVTATTSTYQYDLLQGRFYMAELTGKPSPVIVYSQNAYTTEEATCIINTITYQDNSACSGITWQSQTDSKLKYPAFSEYILVNANQLITLVNVTLTKAYTAVEVFNTRGELCGTSISPIIGEVLSFICIDLPTTIPEQGYYQVRYLGATSIVDIPEISLNPNELYLNNDELTSYISYMQFSPSTSYNLLYLYLYLNVYAQGYNSNFPYRSNGVNWDLGADSTYSISYVETTLQSGASNSWALLANNILYENEYPHNYALEEQVSSSLVPEDTDYTSEEQLDYLYNLWETWYAPRFCGADSTQCKTFNLGKCVVQPDPILDQRWLNGEPGITYVVRGTEGGCDCYNDFQHGFYSFPLFCSQCLSNYGPLDLDNWGDNIQYSLRVKPLFNVTEFPFNLLLL